MADALGKRVICGAAVSHVSQSQGGIRATGMDFSVAARRAIVTVPPALAGRLHYEPPLPPQRDHLMQRMPMRWPEGVWTRYGQALRAPFRLLHWAGTETASIWNGKMEGALLAAKRATAEVLSPTSSKPDA